MSRKKPLSKETGHLVIINKTNMTVKDGTKTSDSVGEKRETEPKRWSERKRLKNTKST